MDRKIAEIRLTLFALISALETDLRDVIRDELLPTFNDLSFIKEHEVQDKIIKRFEKDNPELSGEFNFKVHHLNSHPCTPFLIIDVPMSPLFIPR